MVRMVVRGSGRECYDSYGRPIVTLNGDSDCKGCEQGAKRTPRLVLGFTLVVQDKALHTYGRFSAERYLNRLGSGIEPFFSTLGARFPPAPLEPKHAYRWPTRCRYTRK